MNPTVKVKASPTAPHRGTVSLHCLICGNDSVVRIDGQMSLGAAVRCPVCTVSSTAPFPTAAEVAQFYENYGPEGDGVESAESLKLVELQSPLVNYLVKLSAPKNTALRFFDYGCGGGHFLRQVVKEGHQACGAEFSVRNCNTLKKFAIEAVNLRNEDLSALRGRKFDRITLFQVVEHLLVPQATLRELSEILEDDGILYLECPNDDGWMYWGKSLTRKFFNRPNFFRSLNPPHHVHGFNEKSLTLLLRNSGFEVVEVGNYGLRDLLRQPEAYFFYPTFKELFTREKFTPYYFAKWAIGAFDPLFSKWFRKGAGVYAVARKPKR